MPGKGSTIKRFIENMMPKSNRGSGTWVPPMNKIITGLGRGIKIASKGKILLIGVGILGQ